MAKGFSNIELLTVASHFGGKTTLYRPLEKPNRKVKWLQKSPRRAANELLTNSTVLRSISSDTRLKMCKELFPHFELPDGWLTVALEGGLMLSEICELITSRVESITSARAAKKERTYLTTLLKGGETTYGSSMSEPQLKRLMEALSSEHVKPWFDKISSDLHARRGPGIWDHLL